MHSPAHMRSARAAMLQAALTAYFADVLDDGDTELAITVSTGPDGVCEIDFEHRRGGFPTSGYSL